MTFVGARAEAFAARRGCNPGENNFPGVGDRDFMGRWKDGVLGGPADVWANRRGARDLELHGLPCDVQSVRQLYGHGPGEETVRRAK